MITESGVCVCVIVVVIVIEAVASNRKSKEKDGWMDGWMDGCEKPGKLSSKRERESELFLYFFHLFALDADVCALLLRRCLCARIKQTDRRGTSTSLYIRMSLDYSHIFHYLVSARF